MNDTALAIQEAAPLTAADVKSKVQLVQEVMRSLMIEGVHYGTIPGTQKPSLWKPGAELLCVTFRLAAHYEVMERIIDDDFILYDIKCTLIHIPTGNVVAEGIGSANSREEKYHWRKAVSNDEFSNTADDRKRLKYTKSGTTQQVRVNPYDVMNTIEKIGAKRSLMGATLNATAASDIFTQDLEDMPREAVGGTSEPTEAKSGETCGKCGEAMVERSGNKGKFLGCSGFPNCKNTKQISKSSPKKPTKKDPPVQDEGADPEWVEAINHVLTDREKDRGAYDAAYANLGVDVPLNELSLEQLNLIREMTNKG